MFPAGIFGDDKDHQVSRTRKSIKTLAGSPACIWVKVPKSMGILLEEVQGATYEIVMSAWTFAKLEDVIFLKEYVNQVDRSAEATLRANQHRLWRNAQVAVSERDIQPMATRQT